MHEAAEQAKQKFEKVLEHLRGEFASLRSGRATPALVEHVRVEAYGTTTPLIELASISAPEPKLIVVSPWDTSITKEVERALQAANLGMTPTVDGTVIRLNLPPLNEERRRELVKVLKGKLEEARVAIRNAREEILRTLKDQKTKGTVNEDDFFSAQRELQKVVDDYNDRIKAMGDEKEKDIMTV